MLKKWAKDPKAPGALPGLAASGNAIDAVVFANLATEEGGLATMGEAIEVAHQATLRCSSYMEELVQWLRGRFAEDPGSPSPLRAGERPSGSNQQPDFGKDSRQPLARKREPTEQRSLASPCSKQARTTLEPHRPSREAREMNDSRPLPERPRAPAGDDPARRGVPCGFGGPCPGAEGPRKADATPFQILRAQQILERLMPFLEQEAATLLQDAHSMLFQWTTALWGEPVMLTAVDGVEGEGGDPSSTQPEREEKASDGDSCVATVPFSPPSPTATGPGDDGQRGPAETASSTESERLSGDSHRRRRMHGAFDGE